MNPRLKRACYGLAGWLGVYRLWRHINRREALIITYHGILPGKSDVYTDRNCVDAAMFDRQMAFMSRHYNVVPLPDIVEWLSSARKLPRYTAAITFDDGFRNNFTVALPVLKKYRLPATVFLATGFVYSMDRVLWTVRVDRLLHQGPG